MKRSRAGVKVRKEEGDAKTITIDPAILQNLSTFLPAKIEFLLVDQPRTNAIDAEMKRFAIAYRHFRSCFRKTVVVYEMEGIVTLQKKSGELKTDGSPPSTEDYDAYLRAHTEKFIAALPQIPKKQGKFVWDKLNHAINSLQKNIVVFSLMSEHQDFFLAPIVDAARYQDVFQHDAELKKLNGEFKKICAELDEKNKEDATQSTFAQYSDALQGICSSSGLQQGSFELLHSFFGRNIAVLNFLYNQRVAIEKLARIYAQSLTGHAADVDAGEELELTQPLSPQEELPPVAPPALEPEPASTPIPAHSATMTPMSDGKEGSKRKPSVPQGLASEEVQQESTPPQSAKRRKLEKARFVGGGGVGSGNVHEPVEPVTQHSNQDAAVGAEFGFF